MAKSNILLNKFKTYEDYSGKYKTCHYRLLKYTKKEVEHFDSTSPLHSKNALLKGRKWTLIGDTYYEIPRAPRWTWFRGLNAGAQAGIALLGAGLVGAGVATPLIILNNSWKEISLEDALTFVKKTYADEYYDSKTHIGDYNFTTTYTEAGLAFLQLGSMEPKDFTKLIMIEFLDITDEHPEYSTLVSKIENSITQEGNDKASAKVSVKANDTDRRFNSLNYTFEDGTTEFEDVIEDELVLEGDIKPKVYINNKNRMKICGTYKNDFNVGLVRLYLKITDCTFEYDSKGRRCKTTFNFNNNSKCEFMVPDAGINEYTTLFTGNGNLTGKYEF